MTGTRPRESAVDRIRERVEEKAARRAAAAEAAKAAKAAGSTGGGDPDPNRPPADAPTPQELPGIHADKPTAIPWRGWKQILKRAWAENKADNMPIIAGGVAFFGFLSIFPAMIALISIYGLVASPETVARQVEEISAQLPQSAADLIGKQLHDIVSNDSGALTVSLIVSILGALWSVSGGVGNVITAVNIAYDEVEARNFIKLKLTSLALTLGGIVFKQIWKAVANEDDAPSALQSEYRMREVVLAAAIQGAIFAATKAAIDRAGARTFTRLTGSWPGD